ncbi:MAG: nuclear transport factor 2 family protein [Woeseiaceae bacterium]|nr:nuclear transport factor 2 family protein [Woeseiaceae bacterium]
MHNVFRAALAVCLALVFAIPATADDRDDLKKRLDEFLYGASRGDADVHESFWAEELVYTSSSGTRTDKSSIVEGMRAAPPSDPDNPAVVYTAEDVDIRVYDDMAVVAFRLVGTAQDESGVANEYFNTGTFQKREGRWKAVAWQATRIPAAD